MMSGSEPSGADADAEIAGVVITGVLGTLRQSRLLLLDPSPHNIDRCRTAIAQCVRKVGEIADTDRSASNNSDLRSSLLLVRSELSAIAGLLDSAAVWRRDMLKVISTATKPPVIDIRSAPKKATRVHVLG